ncbi:hypothetical protein [Lactococcus allomyrinae]|nr:hypothetical protein [Lactococcus allomyrinae]
MKSKLNSRVVVLTFALAALEVKKRIAESTKLRKPVRRTVCEARGTATNI